MIGTLSFSFDKNMLSRYKFPSCDKESPDNYYFAQMKRNDEEYDRITNWKEIHGKIMQYRRDHDVKIREFLGMCSLVKDNLTFQQFCSSDGCNHHPHPSFHKVFLQAVNAFFEQKQETGDVNVTREHSLKDIVRDIELEDGGVLHKLGVYGYISCKGEDSLVVSYLKGTDRKPAIAYLKERIPRKLRFDQYSEIVLL